MAGLSLMPTEGEAATYMEATDFGGNFNAATDLTSTFSNFLNDSIITGSIQPVGTDTLDFFRVNNAPRPLAKNNFRNPHNRLVRLFESFNTCESLALTSSLIPILARSRSLKLPWIVAVTTKCSDVSTPSIYC